MTEEAKRIQKEIEAGIAEAFSTNPPPCMNYEALTDEQKALACTKMAAQLVVERLISEKVKRAEEEMGVHALLSNRSALKDVFGVSSYQLVWLRVGKGLAEDVQEEVAEGLKPRVAKYLTEKVAEDKLLAIAMLYGTAASYLSAIAKEHPEDWRIQFESEAYSGKAEICKLAAACVRKESRPTQQNS